MKIAFGPQGSVVQSDCRKSALQMKLLPLFSVTANPLGKGRSQPEVGVMSSGATSLWSPPWFGHLGWNPPSSGLHTPWLCYPYLVLLSCAWGWLCSTCAIFITRRCRPPLGVLRVSENVRGAGWWSRLEFKFQSCYPLVVGLWSVDPPLWASIVIKWKV